MGLMLKVNQAVKLLKSTTTTQYHLKGATVKKKGAKKGQIWTIKPKDTLDNVGETYMQMALTSYCNDGQRVFSIEEDRKLIEHGADAIVLAGTDLKLAFDGRDVGYKVIDALDMHLVLLTDLALGHADLNEHTAGLTT